MSDDIARGTKVRPAGERVLHIRFAGEIARSVHFAPLMDDPTSFAEMAIIEDGLGVAWPIRTKWGRLDIFGFDAPADCRRAGADDGH